jgi:hypothetical protein
MNSYSTEDALSDLIEIVLPQIKLLPKGSTIRAEYLFEPDFWLGSTKGVRLELGRLVADLVRQNRLPLAYASKATNNHQQYIVI